MPAEDQSEPRLRFDPPPSPSPGPARLGAAGPRFPEEPPVIPPGDEVEAARPLWRGLLPLGVGVVAGLALLAAILAVLHRSPSAPATPSSAVPAASDSGTAPAESQPAAASPAASNTGSTTATPSPAPTTPTSSSSTSSPSATPPAATPSPAPTTPPVAHAPPAAAAPPAAPAPAAPAAKAPSHAPVAAVPANGPKHHRRAVASAPWIVQAGAFRTETPARHVADKLTRAGYHTRVAPRPHGWFAIEVTGYSTKAAAAAAAKKLADTQHVPVFVRRSEGK